MYYDFHFPLQLMDFLKGVLSLQTRDPNAPIVEYGPVLREWFSQPRVTTDPTTEVLTIQYKLPLSVSEIGFEALRVPVHVECWYQDRSNNWRQVVDHNRTPVAVDITGSQVVSWYKYHAIVYPIVVKAIQLRMTRNSDPIMGNQPYVVGIKNTLVRRNVYTRQDGTQSFEDEQDVVGNVISKYIKDWDAPKAFDDNPNTFWRSAPMPDPAAVVNLYLDVRASNGSPKAIDRLFIDPVYGGQKMNVYYSTDDTVGVRKLSPVTLPPDTDENTTWQLTKGRWDSSIGIAESRYLVPVSWGPLIGQPIWLGIEWQPDFAPGSPPAQNPVLFTTVPDAVTTGIFTPIVFYDVGSHAIVLELTDGTTTHTYTALLNPVYTLGNTLRIVVGWQYNPDSVYISVRNIQGTQIAFHLEGASTVVDGGDPDGLELVDVVDGGIPTPAPTNTVDGGMPAIAGGGSAITLPVNLSLDGHIGFKDFHGLLTSFLIKQESYEMAGPQQFQASPEAYVSPDPVIPDVAGNIPSTTLDNAIYAVDFTLQQHGTGGSHGSHYEDKNWTPIWKDYVTQKGMCFFPQTLPMKYLKLEFTNLTEEPYPVYDAGVQVTYQVYPVSVEQQSGLGLQGFTNNEGFLGLGQSISDSPLRAVNWLNASTVANAINAMFGTSIDPVSINVGNPYITTALPNTNITDVLDSFQREFGNQYIYRRDALDPFILAQNAVDTIIKAEGLQKLAPFTSVPWTAIEAANPGAIQHRQSPGALPVRGTDWWIFPGQTLKIPATVMNQLTAGGVVTEFKGTLEHRIRFQTSSVHRYDLKTITRDKSIAYFAGLREVTPYTVTYIAEEDKPTFNFNFYDRAQWVFTNITQLETGPITTADDTSSSIAFKDFVTTSDFAKVEISFQDSGLLRSDYMWARADPLDTNIPTDKLSPHSSTIPGTIPMGFWDDHFAEWDDTAIDWGEPHSVISITIDGNRQYQGNRVINFSRDAGAAEAGMKVVQTTNMIADAFVRLGAVFYKPLPNNNQIIVRLRRVSDGVYIYTETITTPTVGYWYQFQSKFFELPAGADQTYTVEFVSSGDDADRIYLSDLYTEVSHIRYFARLGDSGSFLHEVTDLRYAKTDLAVVTTTTPVSEFSIQAAFLSNKVYAYGVQATPCYLK